MMESAIFTFEVLPHRKDMIKLHTISIKISFFITNLFNVIPASACLKLFSGNFCNCLFNCYYYCSKILCPKINVDLPNNFKQTPLRSGRVTVFKRNFSKTSFFLVNMCRVQQSILWYLNICLIGWQFIYNLYYIC